jgi:hypothetical protein
MCYLCRYEEWLEETPPGHEDELEPSFFQSIWDDPKSEAACQLLRSRSADASGNQRSRERAGVQLRP